MCVVSVCGWGGGETGLGGGGGGGRGGGGESLCSLKWVNVPHVHDESSVLMMHQPIWVDASLKLNSHHVHVY